MLNLAFSTITYAQLQSLVSIEEQVDDSRFDAWFPAAATVDEPTSAFLADLTRRHRRNIDGYSEEEVKAKMVIPILNRIDFTVAGYTDWYERPLSAQFGDVTVSGTTDYLIARGEKEPVAPVFFLQEFKPNFTNRSPEVQLVTEMVVATRAGTPASLAGSQVPPPAGPASAGSTSAGPASAGSTSAGSLRGAYLTGPLWRFVILDQHTTGYTYYVSPTLDLFKPGEAAQIYTALDRLKYELVTNS